jgi:hypothetical protein
MGEKKVIEHEMRVVIFCTPFFSEKFLIPRRIHQDIVINVPGVFLS